MTDLLFGGRTDLIDLALLGMRLVFGICFVIHGLGKLGLVGSGNMEGFVGWLESLKVPMPALNARIAMATEVVGGAFLAVGLLTRPVSILLCFTMLVATFVGHKGAGYLITNDPPGGEYAFNMAVVAGFFAIVGAGLYSADHWIAASI